MFEQLEVVVVCEPEELRRMDLHLAERERRVLLEEQLELAHERQQVALILSLELAEPHGPVVQIFNLDSILCANVAASLDDFIVLLLVDVDQRRHLRIHGGQNDFVANRTLAILNLNFDLASHLQRIVLLGILLSEADQNDFDVGVSA